MSIRSSIQGESARYEPLFKLASGGMATVYVGRLVGALGFERLVAIKRPHRHLLEDPRSLQMLLDEAILASKLQHPNIVSVQDVVRAGDVLYLVMDLVEGASMSELQRCSRDQGVPVPAGVALRMLLDTCAGLHAAHELSDDDGNPMGLVHRDVSPHNVLVGVDGVARVSDFGIAKCVNVHGASTTTGALKGKYAYMAPEHIKGQKLDRRADVFALGIVAWELLSGKRLFQGESPANTMLKVVHEPAPLLSSVTDAFGSTFDDALALALSKDPAERFLTAEAFEAALRASAGETGIATPSQVGKFVRAMVGDAITARKRQARALLESRVAGDDGRPTEPFDSVESVDGEVASGIPPITSSLGAAAEANQREPLVSVHGPTDMSSIASHVPSDSPARRSKVWPYAVVALIFGGLATFGIQQVVGAKKEPEPVDSAAASASSVVSVPPSVEPEPRPEPTDVADAGQDTGSVATASPRSSERGREHRLPREESKDAGTKPEPSEDEGSGKAPPPNPYASGG